MRDDEERVMNINGKNYKIPEGYFSLTVVYQENSHRVYAGGTLIEEVVDE